MVRIGWHRLGIPERRFTQQMGVPTELSLEEDGGGYLLCSQPVRELMSLAAENDTAEFRAGEQTRTLSRSPYDITVIIELAESPVKIEIFGTEVLCDTAKGTLTAGGCEMMLRSEGGTAEVRLLSDRASLEIFTCGAVTTVGKTADYNLPYIRLSSDGDFKALARIVRLRSIWH